MANSPTASLPVTPSMISMTSEHHKKSLSMMNNNNNNITASMLRPQQQLYDHGDTGINTAKLFSLQLPT